MLISAFRSGNFEISIYNSLEKIISDRWDEMKSNSLRSNYLQFIEESKPGDLHFRYVIIEEIAGADLAREDAFRVIDTARRALAILTLEQSAELARLAEEVWSDATGEPSAVGREDATK